MSQTLIYVAVKVTKVGKRSKCGTVSLCCKDFMSGVTDYSLNTVVGGNAHNHLSINGLIKKSILKQNNQI